MFELPEFLTLAQQMNQALTGRVVQTGSLGNSPHKFVWYNRTPEEFAHLIVGKTVGHVHAKGRWLFVPLEPDYVLVFGECGGKILLNPPDSELPKKYHLHLLFDDDSFLTATTQMWGAMELYEQGKEEERNLIKEMRLTAIDPAFTFAYFSALIDSLAAEKRSAKSLLTQDQLIPGLGNAIAQDILFTARLHPKHLLRELDTGQQKALYTAIIDTIQAIITKGGRHDEFDLFGERGGYIRLMDKQAAGQPCPICGTTVEKIQYLGGACYFCPQCQR